MRGTLGKTDRRDEIELREDADGRDCRYWANIGHQNVDMADVTDEEHKPSYLDRDNFSDGGQEGITTGGASHLPSGDDEDESASASIGESSKNDGREDETDTSGNGLTDTQVKTEDQNGDARAEQDSSDQSSWFWKGKSNASCKRRHRRQRRYLHWLVYRD